MKEIRSIGQNHLIKNTRKPRLVYWAFIYFDIFLALNRIVVQIPYYLIEVEWRIWEQMLHVSGTIQFTFRSHTHFLKHYCRDFSRLIIYILSVKIDN